MPNSSSAGSAPPRVAVVVVTYHSEAVLPGLIASLPAGLEGVKHELVVVDNASQDGTLAVLGRLAPEATVVRAPGNLGYAAGINAGRRAAAEHDAVLILNPDIRLDRGAVRAMLETLDAPGGPGVVVPVLRDESGALAPSLRREPLVRRALAEALLGGRRAGRLGLGELVTDPRRYAEAVTADWATGAAMLVSAACFDAVGPWDESFFLYSEETDFCLRARDEGFRTTLAPAAEAVHLGGEAPASPRLWALLTANRVKLFAKRHGRLRAAAFRAAMVLDSALRAARGSATRRAALRALVMGSDRPRQARPGRAPTARQARAPTAEARRRPHVLIWVQNLPVPLDRRVWLEAQALVGAGFRVSVVCPKGAGDPRFEVRDGVRIHKYAPPPTASGPLGFAFEFAYCWLRTAGKTARVAARHRVDVVQACNPPDTFFALAALLKATGTRFVFDQHDLCPEIYQARFGRDDGSLLRALLLLERLTYRVSDRVIATNDSYRRIAIERGGMPPARVAVVRNGPDLDRLRPAAPDPGLKRGRAHLCCYLGIMGPQDGVELVVRTAEVVVRELGRDDVTFALLGFGDCLDDLRRLTTELGLDEWVEFTGRADDDVIRRYLSTADVGLSPDPINAFNDASTMNKTMEYMAFGLPVVAFDLTETRVSAGEAGTYVPVVEPRAYAKALVELLDDEPQRARMGAAGIERVRDELAWAHQAPAYLSLYRRLLGDGPLETG